jgi:DNA-binding HxlR family transcriptional regulator
MRTYGQYCPIARGAEIFAERWTPLIVRNLFLWLPKFSEILEGAPGQSRTLLSQRYGSNRTKCVELPCSGWEVTP